MTSMTEIQMDRITGGEVTGVTLTCIAAGGLVGALTGPIGGVFTTLACNELLDPPEAY